MLRLSNLADYGVIVMVAVARSAPDVPMSAAQVAAQSGVPLPTVAKLLGQLARCGLLASARGVSGGFSLARPAAAISLADIVESIDGPIALTHCAQPHGECDRAEGCPARPHWEPVNRAVRAALSAVTLAELAPAAAPSREQVHA